MQVVRLEPCIHFFPAPRIRKYRVGLLEGYRNVFVCIHSEATLLVSIGFLTTRPPSAITFLLQTRDSHRNRECARGSYAPLGKTCRCSRDRTLAYGRATGRQDAVPRAACGASSIGAYGYRK